MNLVEARQRIGLNREITAVRLGVSVDSLRRWEKGLSSMPSNILPKLQRVLSLSDAEVLSIVKLLQKEAG